MRGRPFITAVGQDNRLYASQESHWRMFSRTEMRLQVNQPFDQQDRGCRWKCSSVENTQSELNFHLVEDSCWYVSKYIFGMCYDACFTTAAAGNCTSVGGTAKAKLGSRFWRLNAGPQHSGSQKKGRKEKWLTMCDILSFLHRLTVWVWLRK